jgi:hypothetical protein
MQIVLKEIPSKDNPTFYFIPDRGESVKDIRRKIIEDSFCLKFITFLMVKQYRFRVIPRNKRYN